MERIQKYIAGVLGLVVVGVGFLFQGEQSKVETPVPTSYEECVLAGGIIFESYPEQCRMGELSFVRDVGNAIEKMGLIRVASPQPGDRVKNPIVITGEARGYWFFEATFPIELQDENGKIVGSWYAEATSEWMTTEFVPFKATLPIEFPFEKGTLILRKSNASGLPEHDDELRVPLFFDMGNQGNNACEEGSCTIEGESIVREDCDTYSC